MFTFRSWKNNFSEYLFIDNVSPYKAVYEETQRVNTHPAFTLANSSQHVVNRGDSFSRFMCQG